MRFFGAVLVLCFTASTVAATEECGCDAIGAGGVVFADDLLVSPEYGYTAFVYPDMVILTEGGECLVENFEAFSEGEPMATFIEGEVEYGQILIFTSTEVRNPGGQFATLDEVEVWAESICFPSVS
jgi:hypothetical protein